MSDLRVNNLKARTDGNVPTIVGGAVISGITTISGVLEAESGITAENVSATGIATISTAIVGTAVTINSSGVVATGVVTATSFTGNVTGNATGLTGSPDVDVNALLQVLLLPQFPRFRFKSHRSSCWIHRTRCSSV